VLAVVGLVWAVILVLVGGRFLALLLDANRDSEIIDRLYRHSDFWVKPFFDILDMGNKAVEETGGVFEAASAVAFVVYFLIGALIIGVLRGSFYSGHTLRHA
jgi:hypothetical protein